MSVCKPNEAHKYVVGSAQHLKVKRSHKIQISIFSLKALRIHRIGSGFLAGAEWGLPTPHPTVNQASAALYPCSLHYAVSSTFTLSIHSPASSFHWRHQPCIWLCRCAVIRTLTKEAMRLPSSSTCGSLAPEGPYCQGGTSNLLKEAITFPGLCLKSSRSKKKFFCLICLCKLEAGQIQNIKWDFYKHRTSK